MKPNPEEYAIDVDVIPANFEYIRLRIVTTRESRGTATLGYYPAGMHYVSLVPANVRTESPFKKSVALKPRLHLT